MNTKLYFILGGLGLGLIGGLLFFSNCYVIINAGKRGVVLNLGKVEDTILDEGIHLKTPFVTNIVPINVRVQKTDIKAQAATRDLQTITADIALNWRLDPNKVNKIYQTIGDESQIISGIITPAVTEVLKASTATKNIDEIIQKRNELKEEIDKQLIERLKDYGLIIEDISLVNFDFSPEFVKAVEAKQIAEQQAKQAEYDAIKAEKQAQADINRAKGQAEAQKLLRLSLTPELLQKQAIEKWDGQFPQVMGNGALPFINISPDKLKSRE